MITFRPSLGAGILLCWLIPYFSFSQDIQWEKSYGGRHAEYLFDAVPTADYGFILAGSSLSGKTGNKTSANKGNLDYWIWKMDEKGEPVWQKSFGGPGIDLLRSILLSDDGGFLLAGSSDSPKGEDKREDSRGDKDYWVIKLDAGGGEQWQKTLGGSGADELACVVKCKDGGYLIGGSSSSDANGDKSDKNRGNTDYWLLRLDRTGSIKWQRTYGGQYADELRSIAATTDGGFIVGGYSNSPESFDKTSKCNGNGDYWLLKLDQDGNVQWQQTYGAAQDDQLSTVLQCLDGTYIAAGYSNSGAGFNKTTSSRSGSDFWLLRLDKDGNSLWQESYDFGKYDVLTSVVENPDGSLLIGGFAKSEVQSGKDKEGTNDYIALKIAADGREIWSKTLGSDGEDNLRRLIATRDGGYLLAGTSNPEAIRPGKRNPKGKSALSKISNGGRLAAADRAQQQIDGTISGARDSVNDIYKEQTSEAAGAVNDALGEYNDSPLKMGVGTPGDLLAPGSGSGGKGTGGKDSSANDTKKLPASRQKSNNLGRNDFWVVKLKDKDKKEKARRNVEAFPNPAYDYTNVVVGYDYGKGTATLYDINGRQLQSFAITERTIPVNLQGLPEGIYLVNIRTDKSNDSVKILKAIKNK